MPASSSPPAADGARERIARVADALQASLLPLLAQLAGSPPRPMRLTRRDPGPGLDKSLASRLVQAARAESPAQLMHLVPSPTGLRILIERAQFFADAGLIARTAQAVEQFEQLLDGLPGGRQGLDASLGEAQDSIREKREQIARQASFKAVSFLFGHYCETLATALFAFPSATPGRVDLLEVHRRVGLRRLTATAQLPLLSLYSGRYDAEIAPLDRLMADVTGNVAARAAADFIVPEASSQPLPALRVVEEGLLSTFLLGGGSVDVAPLKITTAFRLLRAETLAQTASWNLLRIYMLHTPCRRLVRDLYLADGLWPDAFPQIAYTLPSPSGAPAVELDPAEPHYRRVHLATRIEQRPACDAGFVLSGVPDHRETLVRLLQRAGQDPAAFRGWRCETAYPVPLIEMNLGLRFGGTPPA